MDFIIQTSTDLDIKKPIHKKTERTILERTDIILSIGTNIGFWNCQGLRPKRKELQNYLLENQIDILALNKHTLSQNIKFNLPGYDTYKNDRLVGIKGGVAILVKKGLIVNQ